jgi:hypothetical protein
MDRKWDLRVAENPCRDMATASIFPRDDQSALGNPWKRWSTCYNGRHSLLTSAISCSEAVLRKYSMLEENKVFPIEVY